MKEQKVAFIGLGIMGSRMAANLLSQGIDLTVYNRSPEPANELAGQGARKATSPARAVREADVVFTMLSTPAVVEEVMAGENGAIQAMRKHAIWVDCSTVDPASSRKFDRMAADFGIRFLDAPVAGTLPHAQNAQLIFFAGGQEGVLNEVRGLMGHMGKKVLHVGENGMGTSYKMLVNALLGQSMVIFSETILLGEKLGFSSDFLLDTIPELVVAAPFTKFKAGMIRSGEYHEMFPLEWMHKDLALLLKTADEAGHRLSVAAIAEELFRHAVESDLGRKDFAAIHQYLKER